MPSTDIDGSLIIILTETEGRLVYNYLYSAAHTWHLTLDERALAAKLSTILNLPALF
jgi:hypothetical protein